MKSFISIPFPKEMWDPRFRMNLFNAPLWNDGTPLMADPETLTAFGLSADKPVKMFQAEAVIFYGPQDILSPEEAAALDWPTRNNELREAAIEGRLEVVDIPYEYPELDHARARRRRGSKAHRCWVEYMTDLRTLIKRSNDGDYGARHIRNSGAMMGLMGRLRVRVATPPTHLLYVRPMPHPNARLPWRAFHFRLDVIDALNLVYLSALGGKIFEGFLEANPPPTYGGNAPETSDTAGPEARPEAEPEGKVEDESEGFLRAAEIGAPAEAPPSPAA